MNEDENVEHDFRDPDKTKHEMRHLGIFETFRCFDDGFIHKKDNL